MVISHNLHDIFEVADRITVLRLGRNVAVYERASTTQQEVVQAITAGVPTKVVGHHGRQRRDARVTEDRAAAVPEAASPSNGLARHRTAALGRTEGGRRRDAADLLGLAAIVAFFYLEERELPDARATSRTS